MSRSTLTPAAQPHAADMRRAACAALLALGLASATASCNAVGASVERPSPRAIIVAVDRSASRSSRQELAEMRVLLDRLPDQLRAGGDRLVLMEMLGGDSPVREWIDSTAAADDPARPNSAATQALEDFREDVRVAAALLLDPNQATVARQTHIIGTLYRMADHARAAGGREVTLVLLSDMLESSGALELERAGGIPGRQWLQERQRAGRLPDLRNVCVVVVGADVQTARGVAVRAFWRAYLEAAGATLGMYQTMLADPSAMACTGARPSSRGGPAD